MNNLFLSIARAVEDNYVIPNVNTEDPSQVNWTSVIKFLLDVIDIITKLAGIVAFVMIVYAALLYGFSYGDEAKVETAKKTITWALVGLVVVGVATYIVGFVRFQLNTS